MSLWKKISLGVVIVILLLLGSVAFLVGTTSGLHLVFKVTRPDATGGSRIAAQRGSEQQTALLAVHW